MEKDLLKRLSLIAVSNCEEDDDDYSDYDYGRY